jgi:hypothetical protein
MSYSSKTIGVKLLKLTGAVLGGIVVLITVL